MGQAAGVGRQVLRRELEIPQLFAGLDLKDVEDELQGVPRIGGLDAAEGDQVLLSRTELYEFDLDRNTKMSPLPNMRD